MVIYSRVASDVAAVYMLVYMLAVTHISTGHQFQCNFKEVAFYNGGETPKNVSL